MPYLLVVFLFIINLNCSYLASTIEQSILGEFNLIFSSEKEVLRKSCINTIKSHTENLFSKYGSVDTVSFLVYITDQDDEFKSLTSKNIPTWAIGVAKGNKIVVKSPRQKSMTYNNYKNHSTQNGFFLYELYKKF